MELDADRTSVTAKLTKSLLDSATHAVVDGAPRARLYLDTAVTGFGARVGIGKRPVVTFFAQRRVRGQLKRFSLDRFGVLTVEQAREKARAQLLLMGEGKDPAEERRRERARGTTLRQALEQHQQAMRDRKRASRTIADYASVITTFSADWLDRELASVTRADVKERHRRIAADVRANRFAKRLKRKQPDGRKRGAPIAARNRTGEASANAWLRILRAVYQTAQDESDQTLPPNPAARLDPFRIERTAGPIARDDLPKFVAGVRALPNAVTRDLILFMLHTGMRVDAARRVRWTDVDLKQKTLAVPKPKGGRSRAFVLPLSTHLVSLLRARRADHERRVADGLVDDHGAPWVFPALADRSSASGHVVEARAEVPGVTWRPHDLRRTFASVASTLPITPYIVKSLLNHSVPSQQRNGDVTGGYISFEVADLRGPMQLIGDRIAALCKAKRK